MHKKNLFNINIPEVIDVVNNKIIQKINKTLGINNTKKI